MYCLDPPSAVVMPPAHPAPVLEAQRSLPPISSNLPSRISPPGLAPPANIFAEPVMKRQGSEDRDSPKPLAKATTAVSVTGE